MTPFENSFMLSATTVPPIYYITSTGRPENEKDAKPPWIEEDYEDHQIIVKHAQTTLQPFPTQATHRPQVIYENYNPKYNTYDKEPEPKSPVDVEGGKYTFSNFFYMFLNPNNFSNLNSNHFNMLDLRNLQEQVKKLF